MSGDVHTLTRPGFCWLPNHFFGPFGRKDYENEQESGGVARFGRSRQNRTARVGRLHSILVKTVSGLADGRERGIAYGQATDGFGNTEQSIHLLESIMCAQNSENSNAIMAQLESPVPQPTLVGNAAMPNQGTNQSKAAKRARDQAYRERQKKDKIEMEDNMRALAEENKVLRDENGDLQSENTYVNKVLQSQAKVIDQLQCDLGRLKHEYKKQNTLVQILSEKLADSDLSLKEENQKLQNENYLLRQGMGMDNSRLQLIEESVKLKHENRVMKVQLSALCEKLIISENLSSPASL